MSLFANTPIIARIQSRFKLATAHTGNSLPVTIAQAIYPFTDVDKAAMVHAPRNSTVAVAGTGWATTWSGAPDKRRRLISFSADISRGTYTLDQVRLYRAGGAYSFIWGVATPVTAIYGIMPPHPLYLTSDDLIQVHIAAFTGAGNLAYYVQYEEEDYIAAN